MTKTSLALPDTRVAVAGDWHGDTWWAKRALDRLDDAAPDVRTVLHVGDLGVGPWPGETARSGHRFGGFVADLDRALDRRGMTLYLTAGNHDNWDALEAAATDDRGLRALGERIRCFPRPYRLSIAGRSFLSLGGAASVDLMRRRPGRDWWFGEQVTEAHAQAVEDDVAARGVVDYWLSHETPGPVPGGRLNHHVRGLAPDIVAYSDHVRSQVTRGWLAARPSVVFHGHHHARYTLEVTGQPSAEDAPTGEPFTCRIEGLGKEGSEYATSTPGYDHPGNVVVLDVETAEVTAIHGA
ncbi:metallophosphoesterase family protein [Xylanimonas ulmi]|uniref:Calcineurin-like phosphoesterase family protein n=1 Tax=Xylanimonas ulmi TaxID=228973 RepID=A0A4Q7M6I8_9MICO|nr:metallophosphoesterase [Xylanibacterium ulmi]RZS62252.1 calcineurin-like phosphoesterase family protein [Xylanibacterium ulmi]